MPKSRGGQHQYYGNGVVILDLKRSWGESFAFISSVTGGGFYRWVIQ